MKKAAVLLAGGLAMVLAAGPGFAQTSTPSTTSPSSPSMSAPSTSTDTAPVPAKKPSTLSMPHHVTGQVVSADQAKNMLTVKDSKGKDYTFSADKDAMAQLGTLKEGDRVKVSYKKSHDQMIATKIVEAQSHTSKVTK